MNDAIEKELHTLSLENRKLIHLTGVIDVDAFNEEEIHAKTCSGKLLIKGCKLHIDSLDLKSGKLVVKGEIDALVYSNNNAQKGRFKRMFS